MNKNQKQFAEAMYDLLSAPISCLEPISILFTKENGYKDQGWLKNDYIQSL